MSPLPRPVEYNAGQPLERYSAERRRRGVAAESAGFGGAALGAASGASMVGNAKIAGTKIGQHSLGAAEAKLKTAGHPGAQQVARVKRIGASAAKHKIRTNVALGGLTVAAGGLGMMARMRGNEEAGISQGVGRIKAGESYANTRQRTVLAKGALRTALMLSDTDINNPALRKTAKIVNEHGGKILGGAAATGATGVAIGSARGGKNRSVHAQALRRQAVAKSVRTVIPEHFGTPGKATRTLARNPGHLAAAGIVGAGTGVQASRFDRGRTDKQRRQADSITAGTVGGAAGQGAWLGTGYKIRAEGHKLERTRPEGMSRSAHQKIMSDHAKKTGVRQNTKPDAQHAPNHYRSYPPDLPATKYKRALGQMSGGRGRAINAAVVGSGVAAGLSAAKAGRGNAKGVKVTKALYQQESRPSILRYAGMGIGGGLAAWGLGRSGMLGAALGRGVKAATTRGNANALEALRLAQATQGLLARHTAPGERQLRQIRALNTAINRVPARMRPEIAAASGIYLMGSSYPLNRTSYRQVSTDFRRAF